MTAHPSPRHSTGRILFFSAPGAAQGSLHISRRQQENLTSTKANIGQTRPAQHAAQALHLRTLTALANLGFSPKAYPENTLEPSPGRAVRPGIRFGRKEAERVARRRVTSVFGGS